MSEGEGTVLVGRVPGLVGHVLPVVCKDQKLSVLALEMVEMVC
jgi:hypothetical protein